jgi:Flp pilus assembly protein TadG
VSHVHSGRTNHPCRATAGRLVRACFAWRSSAHGQSLTEFAILLPLFLMLIGVSIDFARVYQGWTNLESATRDAAQYLATSNVDPFADDYTTPSATADATNDAKAKYILDTSTGRSFTRTGSGTLGSCTSPQMTTITQALDTSSAAGATAANPIQTVKVLACMPFRTLFPYPIITVSGNWTLRSERTYTLIVGR